MSQSHAGIVRNRCWRRLVFGVLALTLAVGAAGVAGCGGGGESEPVNVGGPDASGGEDASGEDPSGGSDGGSVDCNQGLTACNGVCVDLQTNAANCGACGNGCGEQAVCNEGSCVEQSQDCREEPCEGFAYCDLNTGDCKPGCSEDGQCGTNEECDTSEHECVCVEGRTRFKGSCVNESECNDQFCSGAQYCDLAGGGCKSGCTEDSHCSSGERCETSSHECVCESGRSRFNGECVTQQECDDQFCGDGETCDFSATTCVCESGRTRFNGECVTESECNQMFCDSGEYCDMQSATCESGCFQDSQCGSNATCETSANRCVCNSGTFRLGDACLANRTMKVDTSGEVGEYAAIGATGEDDIHIAYYGGPNNDLKHAWWDGSSWTTEIADGTGIRGGDTSLTLEAGGDPHVAYTDYDNDNLMYAEKSGGSWSTETVDDGGWTGRDTSIAMKNGDPLIAYYSSETDSFRVAEGGFSWSFDDIGDSLGTDPTDIAVDSTGIAHVAYAHSVPRSGADNWTTDFTYTTDSSFSWSKEEFDSDPRGAGVAVDSSDDPHIAYVESGNPVHGEKSGGSWNFSTIRAVDGDEYIALELDGLDRPHLFTDDGIDLAHAWYDGTSWQGERLYGSFDSQGGKYVSADIVGGKYYVAHYDPEQGDLLFTFGEASP